MATVMRPPIPTGSSFDKSSPVSSYADIVSLNNGLNLKGTSDLGPTYLHAEYDRESASSLPSSAPSSPTYTASMNSYFSTPSTNSTLDPNETFDDYDESPFPCYDNGTPLSTPSTGECLKTLNDDTDRTPPSSAPCSEDVHLSRTVNDDQAVEHEPTRHVDYLSHEWREEDIWSSWRYIVSRRKTINNSVRLENASWRTWIKTQNHLKTVSPETLNWLKDCDVTWLYGPLQVDAKKSLCKDRSPPPSHLSTSSSFAGVKKPILKKKSASAVILERSRSQHSLLQRAGEIIRVQQSSPAPRRPGLRRGGSDISLPSFHASSALNTPADQDTPTLTGTRSSFGQSDLGYESKHISFNEEVRQVQAIESDDDDEKNEAVQEDYLESDEDDDGGLMMAPARSRSNRSTPRGSFSDNVNTIVPLPSTTLKYRTDTPEPKATPVSAGFWSPHRSLNHTSSQETLRPTQTGHAFHLDDDPELTDSPWSEEPNSVTYDGYSYSYESPNEPGPNMRRTESGMFMPYDENEEEAVMNDTLFGQAMYAFNTVKDIAHVFRNVVWTRNR